MGWWSEDVLGGDQPLDYLGALEENLGIQGDEGTVCYPLERMHDEDRDRVRTKLDEAFARVTVDEIVRDMTYGTPTPADLNIALQVLAVVVMATGAHMPDDLRQGGEEAARQDEWAQEGDPERTRQMEGLVARLREYKDGDVMSTPTTGLFQKIADTGGGGLVNTGPQDALDAETIYYKLRAAVEAMGLEISDEADDLLGDAARKLTD